MYSFLILSFLAAACHGAAVLNDLKLTGRLTEAEKEDLRKRIEAAGGCNANVCFAIDGSGSIGDKEFLNEKNFVLDVASVIAVDQPAELGAAQYSTAVSPIHPLTPDIASFILAVQNTTQLNGQSFVVGGVNYCFSQLWRRRNEANHMVILGDGKSDIGSDAVLRANLFRRIGGDVSVVAAGFADNTQLLAIAGGKQDHVFEVSSFLDVLALQLIIESLVEQICMQT